MATNKPCINLNNKAMKTTRIIPTLLLSLVFIFLTGFTSRVVNPLVSSADYIHEVIKENLKYPEAAIKNSYTGKVDVIFTIDKDGKINIKNTFADNPEIEKVVKEGLAAVCCKGIKTPYNEHYKITITFRIIG